MPVANAHNNGCPDLIDEIPDPDTVRGWLADSIRRCDLLRYLLRLAIRKATYSAPLQRANKQEADR